MTETFVLRSGRFRMEREADWKRLERLLERAENSGAGSLSDDELMAMPKLYRAALSSLSVARAISLDQALVGYLESLCARAYFFVYGARGRLSKRIGQFFRTDWPLAVQRLLPDILVAVAATILSAVAAYVLVVNDPDWFLSFVPEGLAGGRTPSASREFLRETLFDDSAMRNELSVFATYLFTHNASVSILAFAVGFAFGIPSMLLMALNGCMLGAFWALFGMHDLSVEFGGWLLIHGVTELMAIALAGGAGLHVGRAIAFPGQRTRLDAAAEAGRSAARVMVGVLIMLFIAGILEGVGRQVITSTVARYSIAAGTLLLWLVYFFMPRRAEATHV
ncbi:MAG: stage II sporulation protein M [Hyphomonadaceae bacterium]|nr:stage II sporulation protein M [Hyphomonadaceae bacterium]